MASKKTFTLHNLAALCPERLAAILVNLAEAAAEIKRGLRLELAAQVGGDSIRRQSMTARLPLHRMRSCTRLGLIFR